MAMKALLLVFCLQEVLAFDCAEYETFVQKPEQRNLGITQFDPTDWSVKKVEYDIVRNHRTVALLNDVQPGWKLKKLQIGDALQDLQTGEILINRGIEEALKNPDISCMMCFDTREEKARFTRKDGDLFNVANPYAFIEYDWSNWTVKRFQTTNVLGEKKIAYGEFPRVKPGWKIAKVHIWSEIPEKDLYFDDPKTHKKSEWIRAQLLKNEVPYTITFKKQIPDSNDHNANDMTQQKHGNSSVGKDVYIMCRSVKHGTGQAYEGTVFEHNEGKGKENIVKYKDDRMRLERKVDSKRIWEEQPFCYGCNKTGHYGPFCPKITCSKCSKLGHGFKLCAEDQRCARCNKLGHYHNECPNVPQCLNCWELGHYASQCSNKMLCYNCCRTDHSHISRDCPRNNLQRKNVGYTSTLLRSNSKNLDSREQRNKQGKNADCNLDPVSKEYKNISPFSGTNSKKFELAQNSSFTSPLSKMKSKDPSTINKFKFDIPQSTPEIQVSNLNFSSSRSLKTIGSQNQLASSTSKKSQKENDRNSLNESKSFRQLKYTDELSNMLPKEKTASSPSKQRKRKRSKSAHFEEIYESTPQDKRKSNTSRKKYTFPEIFASIKKELQDVNQNLKDFSYQPDVICLTDQVSSDGDGKQKISTTEETEIVDKSSERRRKGVRKIPLPLYIDGELDQIEQDETHEVSQTIDDIYGQDTSQNQQGNDENESSRNSSTKSNQSSSKENQSSSKEHKE